MSRVYCAICDKHVEYNLTTGKVIYPHREDLHNLTIAQCPVCYGYVGTHKKTKKPLGVIVSQEVKRERIKIHSIIDPLWKDGRIKRKHLYARISEKLGKPYHTAEIISVFDARKIKDICLEISKEVEL